MRVETCPICGEKDMAGLPNHAECEELEHEDWLKSFGVTYEGE